MTQICIDIDGDTYQFDGDPSGWQSRSPDFIKDAVKPNAARPEPHILGVMVAVSEAVASNKSMAISVETWANGWSMTVKEMGK